MSGLTDAGRAGAFPEYQSGRVKGAEIHVDLQYGELGTEVNSEEVCPGGVAEAHLLPTLAAHGPRPEQLHPFLRAQCLTARACSEPQILPWLPRAHMSVHGASPPSLALEQEAEMFLGPRSPCGPRLFPGL